MEEAPARAKNGRAAAHVAGAVRGAARGAGAHAGCAPPAVGWAAGG